MNSIRMTALLGAFALVGSLHIQAQTTPTTTPRTTTQQPGTNTQQPMTRQGWVMFHDSVGTAMSLSKDQMTRLREVDERYRTEYTALGKEPWTASDYRTLSDRRNADIRGLLGDDMYNQWNKRYNSNTRPTLKSTTTTPSNGSDKPMK